MNKKLILTIGILFLVVLAGCKSKEKENPITDVDVRKGIDGLAMSFITNAPPASVFEKSTFPIGVELKNKGAFDIEKGRLVFGFERTYVDVAEDKDKEVKTINIKGKSVFNPKGDEELITLNAQAKTVGPQSETHPSTILATVCYPYETVLGGSVCVDTDIYGEKKIQKACNAKDLIFKDGQGAPVAVTKVETKMLYADENKIRPQFIIYVENKGDGEVIDYNKLADACGSKSLVYTDFNNLTITSAKLSGKDLDCGADASGKVRLKEKKDMIRCVSKEVDAISRNIDAYMAPLEITLSYGYTFTISKDIVIEKA